MGEKDTEPSPPNSVLLQAFEWNVPPDNAHYTRLATALPSLGSIGITALWLPPGCKAASPEGNGYDIYDLYDLGEFEQKGARATKWGSLEDLFTLKDKADECGVALYWDAVLNHKAGADNTERCRIVEVDSDDRTKEVSEPYEIDAWLGFDFPGRGEKYSSQKYHWYHFSGTDYNNENGRKAIYKILGDNKDWSSSVDKEQGNADYMMFADIDYSHPETQQDVKDWGVWITKKLGLKGFRLDAVQHFSERFTSEWVDLVRKECSEDIFFVGEFWDGNRQSLMDWLDKMGRTFSLYDAPLLNNFSSISTAEKADLRKVFDGSLVQQEPVNAVTVVMNHDTQPGQTVETPVEGFFKPLAYSLILLRQEGYPSVFYGDLYGTQGKHAEPPSCGGKLADIILARSLYAFGEQDNYFDEANCIGWVRRGTHDRPSGLACVMSNADPGQKKMVVGKEHKGEIWTDVLGWETGEVEIDDEGCGLFPCPGVSVSIWVNKTADGRDRFPVNFDSDIYAK
ncbi:thermostable alpha-amylase [Rhizodiscina lignyota]|uniref:Thermostable alpha-amylase n=1 Tax=Rhizodiscina lignyota TaxID=1504668 RepID=A0A9P4M1U6_9PEZI|nr:thermostable alpha-amylase [Rhizodiscina lignyota]